MTGTSIELAAEFLKEGKVVGIPTETVYGLAANALNEDALVSVFRIKNRPFFDPLIVHTYSLDAITDYVINIPEIAKRLTERFWPGPLTILLHKTDKIPDIVTSGSDLIAIRVPNHPMTLELLRSLDFPLAAPSANPFGYISPTKAEHVEAQLGAEVSYILDGGDCGIGLESTIIDCSGDILKVMRLGGLSLQAIEQCAGQSLTMSISAGSNPTAPGQLDKHYSPTVALQLSSNINESILQNRAKNLAVLGFGEMHIPEDIYTLNLSPSANIEEAAKNLFHFMRVLDRVKPDLIIAMKVPETGLGAAINDRLKRASAK